MKQPHEEHSETGRTATTYHTEILDVFELTSEFHHPDVNPDHAIIEVADFACSFAINYRGVTLHFDSGQIRDRLELAKTLKDAFNFASDDNRLRTG